MNFRYAILSLVLFSIFIISAPLHILAQNNADTVLVLPFENTSTKNEFNWIGESFADSLTDLLKVPSLNTVSNEERKLVQTRFNVPLTTLPSLATSLKLARESRANLLVMGKYEVTPAEGEVAASVRVTARIVRVSDGSFLTEEIDGRKVMRDITVMDALGNLQTVEGQLAYQLLYKRDKYLTYSQREVVEKANRVPPRAFEAYIKGLLTPEADPRREGFLKNALRLYTEERAGETYADAALELGHYYMNRRDYLNAIDYFSRIPTTDSHYAEGAFYSGLIHWGQNDYEPALATLRPLADDLKLIALHNILGAISLQAARAEKKNTSKSAAFLSDGMVYLARALESSPTDPDVRFNYAFGLFLQQNYAEAAAALRPLLAGSQKDGPAYFLLAKSIEAAKGKDDPNFQEFDNQARKYLPNYAKAETEWQKSKTTDTISLRIKQPPRKDFAAVILARKQNQQAPPPIDETQAMLLQARNLYKSGRDDEALAVINRILTSEPMSAEAYLIMGNIRLRRGELEAAVSALKTALFWDNKLLEGHIALGKIFYEKRDCQQAETYSRSAAELAATSGIENDEVIGLQKMVEKCKR
jgi:tetratricopeptide (TPR) repeat protein